MFKRTGRLGLAALNSVKGIPKLKESNEPSTGEVCESRDEGLASTG
jgi:hypothetical protein